MLRPSPARFRPAFQRLLVRPWLSRRLLPGALAALLGLPVATTVLVPATAQAEPSSPAILRPEELKPGMKGYGLTVVRGTKVERFQVEIIGVLHHALPKQDLILIRCAGLNLEHSGVVAGMSGSPIYVIDDKGSEKLVGALSYGFPFNKDPVAGVTPIHDMLPELDRKLIPPPTNQRLAPAKPQPARMASARMPDGSELRPVAIPLSVSGLHPDMVEWLRGQAGELGFPYVQVAAGGTNAKKPKPSPKFEPGSAISLSLARGDIAITGIGTVTWVRGDRFIAFGHPFKGLGQVHLPVGGADIQWILASQASSFKMGTALEDVGTLDQDRQPAVAGRIGTMASMVPVKVTVHSKDRNEKQQWNVEVTDQPMFFPLATAMVVGNAVRVSEPIPENVAVQMRLRFDLENGREPVEIKETLTGLSGMSGLGEIAGLAMNASKALVFNGFERLRVKSVEAEFHVADDRNLAFLEWARTDSEEVEVGKPIRIKVGLQRPNAKDEVAYLTLPPLPRELAGSTVTVQLGPEKAMPPEFPEPHDVEDLLKFLRSQIPRSRLAAVIAMPEPTMLLRGHRLVGLPLGARDEMAGHVTQVRAGKDTLRTAVDLPWTLNGSLSLKLRVRPAY